MKYRVVTDIATLEKVVDLEIEIWGVSNRDAAPANILHAIVENGGVMLVAEEDSELVGLSLGIPARKGRDSYLWSHMTGVHPRYQNLGIGYALKQAQRQWAVEHGYSAIRWTFDPLQRGNANFNIHRLGARSNIYHVDYYGEMTDGINAGLPSDRLEAVWELKDLKPTPEYPAPDTDTPEAHFLVYADSAGKPSHSDTPLQKPVAYIEIPSNINSLKLADSQLALDWRLAVREVMQNAFMRGCKITDFVSMNDGRFAYVLVAPVPWYMYVLECSDGSLYTGVALDVTRRLRQHNTGKGAAYTAARRPVKLLAAWQYPDQGGALRAESAFKKRSRRDKIALMSAGLPFLNGTLVSLE